MSRRQPSALAQQLGNFYQLGVVTSELNDSPATLCEFVGGRGCRARTLALAVRVLQKTSQAIVLSAETRNFGVARESGAVGLRLSVSHFTTDITFCQAGNHLRSSAEITYVCSGLDGR